MKREKQNLYFEQLRFRKRRYSEMTKGITLFFLT